jgi:hypothetical protein
MAVGGQVARRSSNTTERLTVIKRHTEPEPCATWCSSGFRLFHSPSGPPPLQWSLYPPMDATVLRVWDKPARER